MRAFRALIILAALSALLQGASLAQPDSTGETEATVQALLASARARLERIGMIQSRPRQALDESAKAEPWTESLAGLPSDEERYELLDSVESDLRKVVLLKPCAEAYHLLGVTRLLQLDPDRAASAFRTALEIEGPKQDRYNYLITALIEAGRLDDARRAAEEFIQAYPGDELQGLAMLANIALYAMDAEAMEQAAGRMLKLDPNNLDALITLAGADAVRGDWEEAERKFQAIAARHPEIGEELELLKERLFVLQP